MKNEIIYIESTTKIKVEILRDENSIREAKVLDDLIFKDHQGITLDEISAIAKQDGLLGIKNSEGSLVAEAQIIFNSIPGVCYLDPGSALCYGSAVHPLYRRLGLGKTLMKAKEKLALDRNKQRLILTVRPENAPAILLWQKCGFRIYGYDPTYFGDGPDGGRLLMEKVLVPEQTSDKVSYYQYETYELEIRTGSKPDICAREELSNSLKDGYFITGYRLAEDGSAFIDIYKSMTQ